MAGIGQQAAVRLHEIFDALGRVVETGGHGGHFVTALDGHAVVQLALTETLHTVLEGFEAPREAAHQRQGRHGHRDEERRHGHQQVERRVGTVEERPPRPQQAAPAVMARRRAGRAARVTPQRLGAPHPQHAAVWQGGAGQLGLAGGRVELTQLGRGGQGAAHGVVERQRQVQALRPAEQGALLVRLGSLRAWQAVADQRGEAGSALGPHAAHLLAFALDVVARQPAGHEGEGQQHRQDGGVDAQVKSLHSSVSCLRANT